MKLVVVASLLVASGVQALEGQSATTWIAGGGLSLPSGEFNTYANTGWSLNAAVERGFGAHPTAFRLGVSYTENGDQTALGFHESTKLTGVFGSMVYHFIGSRPHIYALIGFGVFHRDFSSDDPEDPGASDSHFALQLGEGVQFRIRSVRVFIEGRFISTLTVGPFQYFPLVAGVRFGGPEL